MYFRFRGNNIQVVKGRVDPGTGKSKSVPVGSINRETLEISDKLRSECSAQELEEIEAWVRRYRSVDDMKRRYAALTLPEQMSVAAQWYKQASPEEARQAADDLLATMAQLRQVLNRRGLL